MASQSPDPDAWLEWGPSHGRLLPVLCSSPQGRLLSPQGRLAIAQQSPGVFLVSSIFLMRIVCGGSMQPAPAGRAPMTAMVPLCIPPPRMVWTGPLASTAAPPLLPLPFAVAASHTPYQPFPMVSPWVPGRPGPAIRFYRTDERLPAAPSIERPGRMLCERSKVPLPCTPPPPLSPHLSTLPWCAPDFLPP